MNKSDKSILALVPTLIKKMRIYRGLSYRVIAAAYSKKGNLLGTEMNGWRELATIRKGTGKHAEAALIKKFGKCINTIYLLRVGNSGDILPIHPCKSCFNMANKVGIKIIPIHQMLHLC